MKRNLITAFAALGIYALIACNSASTSIQSCQDSCDKMATFKCSSSDTQSQCYDDCDQATTGEISDFNACAGATACDPACRNNVAAFGRVGGGVSTDDCTAACMKLSMCGSIPATNLSACSAQCPKVAYQFQVDCVKNNDCPTIVSACGAASEIGAP